MYYLFQCNIKYTVIKLLVMYLTFNIRQTFDLALYDMIYIYIYIIIYIYIYIYIQV